MSKPARPPARVPGRLPWFATLPALVIGALFTLGPLVVIIAFSFMTRPAQGGGVVYTFTTDAYRTFLFTKSFNGDLVFNSAYLEVFWRSLVQASISTVICFVLAFPLALWIATRSPRAQNLLVLAVTIPFWTNLLVRTYAWILLLAKDGVINQTSKALGLGAHELLYTDLASQLGLIYTFLPFMVLPLYSSLSGFDFRLAEAGYDLGARKRTVLRRIILPMAKPGIISGSLLVFMPALGSYVQPVLLGGGKVLLIGNLIASQFGDSRNWPFGAALSVIILALLGLCLLAVGLWARRSGTKVSLSL
ncbi:spermidine/putrescine transport system permease protein [Propionicimonas paludicola]|uniref:Spermidine/putrescine transport system permease protein n=1 Tax=Propionicimonas paludicola TaxID=185243 RepID=A0A2A9CS55_9ACTN|nr:ABC transporter permease [Propionicimonas paludicola]PFG17264.1 spermidine/putrescine transport system permease protein [Propionicimonas paludicola]